MLSPDDRSLFVDAIRPPDGYQFDRGIGTTFTLDLLTLLVTPSSLALYDRASVDEALQDPLALLEGLRRYADRLSIFCQSGYISVPPKENYLYRYLEDIVVEVKAPGGGVFHPKVWLLRYVSRDGPTIYRLLNLSRNLTFDKSWDLILQLEGQVTDRQVGFSRNRPLSDFIRILPGLAPRQVNDRILQDIDLIQEEIRKVDLRVSYPFQGHPEYYPSGIPGYLSYRFKNPIWRMMVISPFLTKPFLGTLPVRGENHILISTISSIDNLSPQLRNRFQHLYVLDDLADQDPEGEMTSLDDGNEFGKPAVKNVELTGLHAKLFVIEDRWDATWLIGSANATDAAFHGHNVEFMIALKGRKSKIGIDNILGEEENEFSLRALLKPYPQSKTKAEEDTARAQAEQVAEEVRRWLVDSTLFICVVKDSDTSYSLILSRTKDIPKPTGDYTITCWPVSLPPNYRQTFLSDPSQDQLLFRNLSILSITPFMAFDVVVQNAAVEHKIRFVINMPIQGMPDGRDDYLLSAVIANRQQFIRYLRLLLAGENSQGSPFEWTQAGVGQSSYSTAWEDLDMPLLEDLLRALSRSPEQKIDRIAEIVFQLKRTPQYRDIIPEEFDGLWEIIQQARETLR